MASPSHPADREQIRAAVSARYAGLALAAQAREPALTTDTMHIEPMTEEHAAAFSLGRSWPGCAVSHAAPPARSGRPGPAG